MISRSLRIAIDGRPALWDRTGIGTITHNVLRRISALDKRNEYYFYFDRDPVPLASIIEMKRCRHASCSNDLAWANYHAVRFLKADRIDLFISFMEKDIPLVIQAVKVISMIHDVIPLTFPEIAFRNGLHKAYYHVLMGAAIRRADRILTNSNYSMGDIARQFPQATSKLRKVTLGVSDAPTASSSDRDAVLRKYGIRNGYILAVGSTEPRKNNTLVIRAFNLLAERFPSLNLVIVGKQWRDREFDRNLLNDRVVLTGFVPDEELAYLFGNASVFVFPSLYEGFGLPILESMKQGVPTVTSNRSALPEVAGDAAICVNPEDVYGLRDQMCRILSDQVFATALVQKGFARSSQFQWETMCEELIELYAELFPSRTVHGASESAIWNPNELTLQR